MLFVWLNIYNSAQPIHVALKSAGVINDVIFKFYFVAYFHFYLSMRRLRVLARLFGRIDFASDAW
jgi:hypothetical protein